MSGKSRVTGAVVATALVFVAIGLSLGGAVAAAFLYAGVFNVAANDPHWPPVRWALERTLESSVQSASERIVAPSTGPERVTQESLRTYASECAVCHGSPEREPTVPAERMRPEPPRFADARVAWTPSETFWIIKNGLKMTGMPAWGPEVPDERMWDLVAVVHALPDMAKADYTGTLRGEPAGAEQEKVAAEASPDKRGEGSQTADGEEQADAAPAAAAADREPAQESDGREQKPADGERKAKPAEERIAAGQQTAAKPQAGQAETDEEASAGESGEEAETAAADAAEQEQAKGGDEAGAAATVEMTGALNFVPSKVTISAGDVVRWKNVSEIPHTVTADKSLANDPSHVHLPDGAETFNSGYIGPKGVYSRKFTVPGRYQYFCIPHEGQGMIGEIIVE